MSESYLDLAEVCQRTSVSGAEIKSLLARGQFPAARVRRGKSLWLEGEVAQWIRDAEAGELPVRTCLYRHFDAAGRLLYVGVSLCAMTRLGQHRANAEWFGSIASITLEWHPSRDAALAAEAAAIQGENPVHNKAGKK